MKEANGKRVAVIAEIACAHEGSIENAKKLVDAAVAAKADIIQFIVFSTDATTVPYHPAYAKGKTLEFSEQQWRGIIAYARRKKIKISTAVQDIASANLMAELQVDFMKIHSPDISNPELIECVARTMKPLIMTVGASTFEEISAAITVARSVGNTNLTLMYGFQNYPTRVERINLLLIKTLKKKFNCPVGYADHTDGDSPLAMILPIVSTRLGATILEKHITINRAEKGTDYEAALNPDEFALFVRYIRDTEAALGDGIRHQFSPEEVTYRELVKKSICASRDIAAGEQLTNASLIFLRATPGMPPSEAQYLLGKKIKRTIQKYDVILQSDV